MPRIFTFACIVGHAVDAQNLHLRLQLRLADGLVGTHAHGIVVAEHDVGHLPGGNLLLQHLVSVLGVPVAIHADVVELAVALHGLRKAAVALLGGRGGHGGCHLQHAWPVAAHVAGQAHGIAAHSIARLGVVAADEGCIVVCVGRAVEEYHGNALRLHAGNGFGHGGRLGGSHDQKVDAGLRETVDLLNLTRGIVLRVVDAHADVLVVEVLGGQHLAVHFLAPLA